MQVMKMSSGYAYVSSRPSLTHNSETVVVSDSDIGRASFRGIVRLDNCDYCAFRIGKKYYWQLRHACVETAVKAFTQDDIEPMGSWDHMRLSVERSQLADKPLRHHKRGLSQTASGYGRALVNSSMIWFEGRYRRIYTTCFSNSGTSWFNFNGKKIVVG